MNNNNNISKIHIERGFFLSPVSTLNIFTLNTYIANFLMGVSFFYILLITIQGVVIISTTKQKLLIELFKTTERACNDLTVLSCDLNIKLKVVSGYGMPLIVIKSI